MQMAGERSRKEKKTANMDYSLKKFEWERDGYFADSPTHTAGCNPGSLTE